MSAPVNFEFFPDLYEKWYGFMQDLQLQLGRATTPSLGMSKYLRIKFRT